MKIVKHTLLNIFVICFVSISPSFAYEEANLEKVMTELKSTNSALFKKAEKVSLIGMGNKFEVWNENNWEMRQTGGALSTEILEVVLPESLKTISF